MHFMYSLVGREGTRYSEIYKEALLAMQNAKNKAADADDTRDILFRII